MKGSMSDFLFNEVKKGMQDPREPATYCMRALDKDEIHEWDENIIEGLTYAEVYGMMEAVVDLSVKVDHLQEDLDNCQDDLNNEEDRN